MNNKSGTIVWIDECDESFQNINTLLTLSPILLTIECKDFIIYCDVSRSILGVALIQVQNVIYYALR